MEKDIIKTEVGSPRSFGILFTVISLLFASYFAYVKEEITVTSAFFIMFGLGLGVLSLTRPQALEKPNLMWLALGNVLSRLIGPLIMFLVYCLTILPTGLIMRLKKRDILRLKKKSGSYWILRDKQPESMDRQF